jgi:hypothetical protein
MVLGLAMLAFAGQAARAGNGNVTIYITEDGLTPISFDFTSPLANPITPGDRDHLLADANGPGMGNLNFTLAGLGYDFAFQTLSANSNLPGTGTGGANLFMTGQLVRTTAAGGDKTIQIDVSQNNYLTNPASTLSNSATALFTNAPGGNNQLVTSYFNTNNSQNDTSGPHTTTLNYVSTGTGPNAHPGPGEPGSSSVAVNSLPPFSLTGRLVITLGQLSNLNNPPTDQFSISSVVNDVSVVPEPASIALMGEGLTVVIVASGWLRRRRAAAWRP